MLSDLPDHAYEPAAEAFGPFLLGFLLGLPAGGADVHVVGHVLDVVMVGVEEVGQAVMAKPVADGVGEMREVAVDDGLDVLDVAALVVGAALVERVHLAVVEVVPFLTVLAVAVGDDRAL